MHQPNFTDRLTTMVTDLCQLAPLTEADAKCIQSIIEKLRSMTILKPPRMHLAIKNAEMDKVREDIMFTMEVGLI
jgi:hypothetical protein